MPFDLSAPRTVEIVTGRNRTYTLTLKPPTKAQWLAYFAGIQSFSERVDGRMVESFDSTGARVQLVTECLTDATGYKTNRELIDTPNWQSMIPVPHRLAAGNVLVAVSRDESGEDEAILLGAETVRLKALANDPMTPGMTSEVSGLIHYFTPPTVEQTRRYHADLSRSVVVGGSRSGKTRWMGAQATLVALYDELIVGIEGYVKDDFAGFDKDSIIRYMDTFHKVAAAEALFAPVSPSIQEDEVAL